MKEGSVFCNLRFRFPGDRSKKSESKIYTWYSSVYDELFKLCNHKICSFKNNFKSTFFD